MSKRFKYERIVDEDTGEVLSTKVIDLFNRWDDRRGWKYYQGRASIMGVRGKQFPEGVSDAEIGRLARISQYLIGDSGILGYRGSGNTIKPVTLETMSHILGISQRSAYRLLSTAREKGLIAEMILDGQTWFCMNPLYFTASDWIPLSLFLCFREHIEKDMPRAAIEHYEAAMALEEDPNMQEEDEIRG